MNKLTTLLWVLFALFAALPASAAVTAGSIWEVWTTGASDNGGCFDPTVSVPGTDRSQQTGSQKTYTDLVIDGATDTDATSAANPFVAADVGNCYNITGGTNFTVQRCTLVSIPSGVIGRFNCTLGTVGATGGTGKMGGALDNLTRPVVVPGNTVYVKATATYTISATSAFSVNGTAIAPIAFVGYTSTRTDGGMVTVSTSTASVIAFNVAGDYRKFRNFTVDCNSAATCRGFSFTGVDARCVNCKAQEFATHGFSFTATRGTCWNCYATAGAGTGAFLVSGAGSALIDSSAIGNTCSGVISTVAGASLGPALIRFISANNSGTSDGIRVTGTSGIAVINSVAYGNGRHGLALIGSGVGVGSTVANSAFANHAAGFGMVSDTTNYPDYALLLSRNAFWSNSSGHRSNIVAGVGDVIATGDPFTNGASGDFSLNSTGGAGAALRAAGFPGALQSGAGGTGYLDIGALQHQDSGGGGQRGYTWVY